jgi:hypothetical protein
MRRDRTLTERRTTPTRSDHTPDSGADPTSWTTQRNVGRWLKAVLTSMAVLLACPHPVHAEDRLEYNRDIRPILVEMCFACHGADSAARMADLRLDDREAAIEHDALVPGKPDESEMIRRILSDDPDEQMPPPEIKKTLTDRQQQTLIRWVEQGAKYELHWSLIPPERPVPPAVQDHSWIRTPIDNFILAKLERAGLAPAPEADRRTLARRVSLDLTGLPPAPELVEAFVNDASPHAYETLVDTLLDSVHWGEHRGRYWLDYARYADTHGIHFDNFREMWTYRDWVIDAFNDNMPFDQFTIENLAGDLLPEATMEQKIGSGFNRCNMTTNEGGIIDEEYLVLYARDRTVTTSLVWMGLTAECAACHSHKFDPLSQREFYELAAFFNNTTQAAKDGNIKDTPPILVVPEDEDRPRWEELPAEIADAKRHVDDRRKAARPLFEDWLTTATPDLFTDQIPTEDLHLHAPLDLQAESAAVTLDGETRELPLSDSAEREPGHLSEQAVRVSREGIAELPEAGDFDADQPFSCAAWIKLPANDGGGAIVARMDDQNDYRGWDFWIEGRRVGAHVIHKWSDDALKVVSRRQVPANKWTHVAVTYDGSKKAAGLKVYINGNPEPTNVQVDRLESTTRTDVPLKIAQRHTGAVPSGLALQDLRIYQRSLADQEVSSIGKSTEFAATLARDPEDRSEEEVNELYAWWLATLDEPYRQATGHLTKLEREQADIRERGTVAHVMQEQKEEPTAYVLYRGEYDQRREQVRAGTPEVLPPFPEEFPRNRLGFAQWLLLPDHPLTARVTVNRFWQEVFGTGIVRTAGDFGTTGELPSHPELLDWLAIEFRESGWDVKRLFKLMVMSSAYRQSAVVTDEKLQRDPDNRLLSRGPRFRMDAEMVRDYALAASGLLVPRIGGPSVKPYQPPGVWEAIAMNVSNTRSYEQGTGEDLYRRSVYTFVKRMAPPASLELFNAPNREYCIVQRDRTNTPLQALVTLNDEQFVEAARHLAQRAILSSAEFEERLRFIASQLLAREFRVEEVGIIRSSLETLSEHYEAHPEDAVNLITFGESTPEESLRPEELAAWTMLVNQLMNLDEVLNK